jgi:hypothetical protein
VLFEVLLERDPGAGFFHTLETHQIVGFIFIDLDRTV